MNYKKIGKLFAKLRDANDRQRCHEAAIPRIKDELENFFIEQAEGKEQKQEILNSRKLRGFEDRLQRERQGLEIVATEQEVLKRALQQEGLQAIEEIEQALSKDCGEQATRCDELKKRIANLKYQAQQLEHQYLREDLLKEQKYGARKSFKKNWDAEKIIKLITNPELPEFEGAGTVVEHLSDYIKDQWQKAADKRAQANKLREEAAIKAREASIKKNKEYALKAQAICSGKEKFPPELAGSYTPTTVPMDLLIDFIKRTEVKQHGMA